MAKKAYAEAGVDIALAGKLLGQVKPDIKKATRPEVLGSVGGFGGLFDISRTKLEKPVLVSSTDSVGTKVKVANLADEHQGLGFDIVNHCSNDIAVVGAEPLFFLDYFATPTLREKSYTQIVKGLAQACQQGNVALIGGETAELPGVYQDGEYDLVGTIVGVCDKDKLLSGETIRQDDVLIGLASSGLHTNGFSLARKITFDMAGLKVTDALPGGEGSVGEALLKSHINYAPFLLEAYRKFNKGESSESRQGNSVYGVAHITGGGLLGNVPRVLPDDCRAVIDASSWEVPPLFKFLVEAGNVSYEERYEVFNMGIGLVLMVNEADVDAVMELAKTHGHQPSVIGKIEPGSKEVVI